MWAYESVFYQIYPLGFCNAPIQNDSYPQSRIRKVIDWIPHIIKVGANAVLFNPVFESDTHGYNTRDYQKIDCRLGSNQDFVQVCEELHHAGIRVVLDGVFNHAGRGFFAFQDVIQYRENSRYCNWFYLDFSKDSPYHDSFFYEGWEGNYDLVKLNLRNEEVIQYLLDSVTMWIHDFDIDGIRLDVAYMLDRDFMRRLRSMTDSLKNDFFLVGEMLHGNYNDLIQDNMLHSVTNYECYKGLYSAYNSMNLFEIVHSLLRQFGTEQWCLYQGKHLLSFCDNHDVTRIGTILERKEQLPLIYAMLFMMPGIPCVYYGSEWGAEGDKKNGDQALRQSYEQPEMTALTSYIAQLAEIKKNSIACNYGSFRSIYLNNRQCIFERWYGKERLLVAINIDGTAAQISQNLGSTAGEDLLTHKVENMENGLWLDGYTAKVIRCEIE